MFEDPRCELWFDDFSKFPQLDIECTKHTGNIIYQIFPLMDATPEFKIIFTDIRGLHKYSFLMSDER